MDKPGNAWRYGWLDWLGVDPARNRRRIARRLVKQLQERFVSREVRIMLVDTYEGNQKALASSASPASARKSGTFTCHSTSIRTPLAIERKYSTDD